MVRELAAVASRSLRLAVDRTRWAQVSGGDLLCGRMAEEMYAVRSKVAADLG
jgi:hypothetical protein